MCQTGGLLQTCNGRTKISPVLSTPDIVFQPLSMDQTQETDLHYMNKKQVTNMINEVITSNFIQNLIRNVFNCNGNVICSPENSIDPNYDLELARRTNSHTSFVSMFDWRAWAVKTTLVVFIIWIFWRAALQWCLKIFNLLCNPKMRLTLCQTVKVQTKDEKNEKQTRGHPIHSPQT